MANLPPSTMELVEGMLAAAPFLRTLGIVVPEVSIDDGEVIAWATMPDRSLAHNHTGGPHAGALFTLGLTASVAVVTCALHSYFHALSPVVAGTDIDFRRPVTGPARAIARLRPDPTAIDRAVADAARVPLVVPAELLVADDTVAARLSVRWVLLPR